MRLARPTTQILAKTKGMIGTGHTFGLAAVHDDLAVLLDFTSSTDELSSMLDNISPQGDFGPLDLGRCLGALADRVDMCALARCDYVVRVILIHSRSEVTPVAPHSAAAKLLEQPGFYVDILHIWPPAQRNTNTDSKALPPWREMRATLGRCLPDPHFYVHSVPGDTRQIQPAIAALASHALLRPGRKDAVYALQPRTAVVAPKQAAQ